MQASSPASRGGEKVKDKVKERCKAPGACVGVCYCHTIKHHLSSIFGWCPEQQGQPQLDLGNADCLSRAQATDAVTTSHHTRPVK